MRFNDQKYIDRYNLYGEFPKIHDDIYIISRQLRHERVIDLGCCTGLLSARLAVRNDFVLGIEANKKYLDRAVQCPKVQYVNMRIDMDTLDDFHALVDKYKIQTVYARRVMPELYDTGGIELVKAFVKTCWDSNIKHVVLEGRKKVGSAVNGLPNVQVEVRAFLPFYWVEKRYNQCRILLRKDYEKL